MSTTPSFKHQVGYALSHLYDPDILSEHPLVTVLGLNEHQNKYAALRDALISAIEALKPGTSVPIESRAWRMYKLLHFRYVQQLDQKQTAYQLGVSVRHLRREQQVAIQTLVGVLYQRHSVLETDLHSVTPEETNPIEAELSWLKDPLLEGFAILQEELQSALHLVAPMALERKVQVDLSPIPDLPPVSIHPAGLRQAIVSVTTYAINQALDGQLQFSAWQEGKNISLRVCSRGIRNPAISSVDWSASLKAAQSLLNMCNASLELEHKDFGSTVTLVLPTMDIVNVLMIDDNQDVAQLFERYMFNSRFRIEHLADTDHLFREVEDHSPRIIILDVMMPSKDGWGILGRLKQHPRTSLLPVIICTVLPERELALSLGASAFLPKPVGRAALLETLNQVLDEEP